MPDIAASILAGKTEGPQEEDSGTVDGQPQRHWDRNPGHISQEVWPDEIAFPVLLQFEEHGVETHLRMNTDELRLIRFANRHRRQKLLNARCLLVGLAKAKGVKIKAAGWDCAVRRLCAIEGFFPVSEFAVQLAFSVDQYHFNILSIIVLLY